MAYLYAIVHLGCRLLEELVWGILVIILLYGKREESIVLTLGPQHFIGYNKSHEQPVGHYASK